MLFAIAAVMALLLVGLLVMPKRDGGGAARPSFVQQQFAPPAQPVQPVDLDKQLAAQMLDEVRLADAKEIVAGQMARAARGFVNPFGSQAAVAAPSKATK